MLLTSVPCRNPKKESKVVTIAFVTTFYMLRIWLQHYKFSSWTKTSCQQQQQTEWGPSEVFSCLIKCGADPNLIDEKWILNHYKWIVWKITSMVRSYPDLFHDWLTSDKILDQLKYRYEREIIHGHRSAIKSIVEDDDISPAFPMVLCVSNIINNMITTSTTLSSSLFNAIIFFNAIILIIVINNFFTFINNFFTFIIAIFFLCIIIYS